MYTNIFAIHDCCRAFIPGGPIQGSKQNDNYSIRNQKYSRITLLKMSCNFQHGNIKHGEYKTWTTLQCFTDVREFDEVGYN